MSDDRPTHNDLDRGGEPSADEAMVHLLRGVGQVLGDGSAAPFAGRFQFFIAEQRWVWSDAVARMHGYEPGSVEPTTELLLHHKHPEDRDRAAAVLQGVESGEPFSSRHRIVDAAGRTRFMIVVGDRMVDDSGALLGTAGFYVDATESWQSDISSALSASHQSRAVIEQAKGVLMVAYNISAERAFDVLVWRSQETQVKLRNLAARFLAAMQQQGFGAASNVDHVLLTVAEN